MTRVRQRARFKRANTQHGRAHTRSTFFCFAGGSGNPREGKLDLDVFGAAAGLAPGGSRNDEYDDLAAAAGLAPGGSRNEGYDDLAAVACLAPAGPALRIQRKVHLACVRIQMLGRWHGGTWRAEMRW